MKRQFVRPALVLVLLVWIGVIFANQTQDKNKVPEIPAKDWKGEKSHKVLRIIDGDTVVVELDGKETKVRLIGVDTPETVHPTKAVQEYGKEASRFTTNLLKGESVFVEYDQTKTDKYERTLAYLFRSPDGLFVNLEIVRQGYGHAYTKFPFKHMDLFRYHEKQARDSERGLWSSGESIDGKDTKSPDKKKLEGITVYITDSGTKYHSDGCRFLLKSKTPISPQTSVLFGRK